MKTVSLTLKTIFSLAIVVAFLGMAACAKKSNNGATRVQNRGAALPYNTSAVMNGNNMIGGQQGSCNGAQTYGRLFDDGSMYGSFRNNFAEFLETDIGDLDGSANSATTGVNIQLKLKMNGQSIVAEQSAIQFEVIDSLANEMGRIEFSMPGAGTDSSGAVIFKDDYGLVFVTLRNSGNLIQGQVSFQNGNSSQKKLLGSFSMNSCAVLY